MEPYQVLPLQARVNPRAMAMKGYSTLPKAPGLEPCHQMQFNVISKTLIGKGGSYPTAEVQSVYSTALAVWAVYLFGRLHDEL